MRNADGCGSARVAARTWTILHNVRRAMVAPERKALKVDVDDLYLGGLEEGLVATAHAGERRLGDRRRSARPWLPSSAAASSPGSLRRLARVVRPSRDHTQRDRAHRRLAGVRRSSEVWVRSPPAQSTVPRRASRRGCTALTVKLQRGPAGLPRRVRFPSQPTRQSARRVPDSAWSQHSPIRCATGRDHVHQPRHPSPRTRVSSAAVSAIAMVRVVDQDEIRRRAGCR
jgi:hypothetical protein